MHVPATAKTPELHITCPLPPNVQQLIRTAWGTESWERGLEGRRGSRRGARRPRNELILGFSWHFDGISMAFRGSRAPARGHQRAREMTSRDRDSVSVSALGYQAQSRFVEVLE